MARNGFMPHPSFIFRNATRFSRNAAHISLIDQSISLSCYLSCFPVCEFEMLYISFPFLLFLLALSGHVCHVIGSGSYFLVDNFQPSNFFTEFNFFTVFGRWSVASTTDILILPQGVDPTQGYVQYVNQSYAQTNGLISEHNSFVRFGVDSTIVYKTGGAGRPSVRLEGKNSYTHALYVLSLNHMPWGCGTWPAFVRNCFDIPFIRLTE